MALVANFPEGSRSRSRAVLNSVRVFKKRNDVVEVGLAKREKADHSRDHVAMTDFRARVLIKSDAAQTFFYLCFIDQFSHKREFRNGSICILFLVLFRSALVHLPGEKKIDYKTTKNAYFNDSAENYNKKVHGFR